MNNVEINETVKIVFPFFCYRRTATKGAVEALIGSVKHYGDQVSVAVLFYSQDCSAVIMIISINGVSIEVQALMLSG